MSIAIGLFAAAIAGEMCYLKGSVTDLNSTPLSGVTVVADLLPRAFEGAAYQAKTDDQGNFELKLPAEVALASVQVGFQAPSFSRANAAQSHALLRFLIPGFAPHVEMFTCRPPETVNPILPRSAGLSIAPRAEKVTLQPVEKLVKWRIPVVAVDFADKPFAPWETPERLRLMLADDRPQAASVLRYFEEMSEGRLFVDFELFVMRSTFLFKDLDNGKRDELAEEAARWLAAKTNLSAFDTLDNVSLESKPDGRLDGLLVVPTGPAKTMTGRKNDLNPVVIWHTLYDLEQRNGANPLKSVYQTVVPFSAPLGNFVHELMHTMGERKVHDLYTSCGTGPTLGPWDVMDFGMYNPLIPYSKEDPSSWFSEVGYSPSYPSAYVLTHRWFQGAFASLVPTRVVTQNDLAAPLVVSLRAQSDARNSDAQMPQALRISMPDGTFVEVTYRPRVGFERGRSEGRGQSQLPAVVGSSGILAVRIDPRAMGELPLRGPLRVIDARASTVAPAFDPACLSWKLDDAALEKPGDEVPIGFGVTLTLLDSNAPQWAQVRITRAQ